MKALIPVAGVGTRLRPHTYTQPKPLVPVAGKPIIGFIIDELLEVGVREFVFVIGYLGEKIQQFIEEHYPDIETTFIQQPNRMGSGHAIWIAKEALQKEKELNELKTKFLSLVSHEFKTPISGILTSATLAGKYTREDQQDKREKHLNIIKSKVNLVMKRFEYFDFNIGFKESNI